MTEHEASEQTMTPAGRVGVYGLLILLTLIAAALISFDAMNDDTAEVTDQLDPTTLEDAPSD